MTAPRTTPGPATQPLLQGHDATSVVAWQRGTAITAAQYLRDVARQAAALPAHGAMANLCSDRYAFAVGLGAALVRGQASLLPPNAMPETLARLRADEPSLYLFSDDSTLDAGLLPLLRPVPPVLPGDGVPAAPLPVPQIATHGAPITLLTSGSTGAPVPHRRAWGDWVTNIGAEATSLAQHLGQAATAGLRGLNIVATVPPQHSYGLESSVLLALLSGAAFDAGRPYFPADIAEALARLPRPRALVTTPFHLKMLLASDVALPTVDLVLSATAPLSPQLAAQAERSLGACLVEIYGCTEAGQVATRRTVHTDRWQTMGELRIARAEGPADPVDGDAERYVVQGGHVAQATPLADILQLDDACHFRLLGRANDLIHVAGKRSSLGHLNHHLNSIAGVEDGVFWMPHEQADGVVRPVAFVVAPTLTPQQIIGALREHLEPVFVPRRVIHVAALPREATGKITQRALAELAQRLVTPPAGPAPAGALTVQRHIGADHPVFAGHFPGDPVLPGAVLLNEVLQAALHDAALAARLGPAPLLMDAKFLAPVRPDSLLTLALHDEGRVLRFEVRMGSAAVATGRWALADTNAAAPVREGRAGDAQT